MFRRLSTKLYTVINIAVIIPILVLVAYVTRWEQEFIVMQGFTRWALLLLFVLVIILAMNAFIFFRLSFAVSCLLKQNIAENGGHGEGIFQLITAWGSDNLLCNWYDKEIGQLEKLLLTSSLRSVVDACPVAAVVVNKQAVIVLYNDAYLHLVRELTESKADITGLSLYEIYDRICINRNEGVVSDVLQGKNVGQKHIETMGREFLESANAIKERNGGRTIGAIVTLYEITEYENVRAELGKMDRLNLVGEIAASLAHEIRNPMTTIKGYLQLMSRKEENKDRFEMLIGELDRAHQLIEEYLTLARNKPLKKIYKNINEIICSMHPLLYADAVKLSITLNLDLAENLPELLINESEIRQLLLNLCRNATDAMDKKGNIVIRTRWDGNYVRLDVQDNGCGIPEESLQKVTEPFYTTKGNGTGLGLAVCRNIAEKHHAELSIQSVLNKGTTVSVFFRVEI